MIRFSHQEHITGNQRRKHVCSLYPEHFPPVYSKLPQVCCCSLLSSPCPPAEILSRISTLMNQTQPRGALDPLSKPPISNWQPSHFMHPPMRQGKTVCLSL